MIAGIDHIVLTVRSVEATCDFYIKCLGFERIDSADGLTSLRFGHHTINVQQDGRTFEPRAWLPTPGSADFCLIALSPLSDVMQRLTQHRVPVVGPMERAGALGPMQSIFFRDPDGNLIEVSRHRRK